MLLQIFMVKVRIFIGLFLLAFCSVSATAQMASCGKEFFIAQLKPFLRPTLSFVSKHAATVDLNFTADPSRNISFTLVPGQVYSVLIDSVRKRTFSWDPEFYFVSYNDVGKIYNRSLLICSDSDMIVHFGDLMAQLDDVALLYPVRQPDTDTASFFVLGSGAMGSGNINGGTLIISHHDNVVLEIVSTASIGPYPAHRPFIITLNRGEVFALQNRDFDCSGSRIRVLDALSSYPISVMALSHPTFVGLPWSTALCCADMMIDQNLPVSTYDTLYHYVPFMMADGLGILRGQDESPAILRILSAVDNNNIYVDGSLVAHLNQGQFMDTIMRGPRVLTSLYPMAVSQFAQSWSSAGIPVGSPFDAPGDPDHLWLNPLKMGIRESIFKSFHPNPFAITTLTLVADSAAKNILLNGLDIRSDFKPFAYDHRYIYLQKVLDNTLTYHLLSGNKVVAYVTTFINQGGVSYALGDLQSALPEIADAGKIEQLWICDTVTLKGRGWGNDYLWNTGTIHPLLNTGTSGTYWVRSRYNNGCNVREVTDTFHLFVAELPKGQNLSDTVICHGDTITLDAYQEYFQAYLWNTGEVSSSIKITYPGTYSVMASTEHCGGITNEIVVSSPDLASVLLPGDSILCTGKLITLGNYEEGVKYQWNTGDTVCCITVEQSGYYKVTASNINRLVI